MNKRCSNCDQSFAPEPRFYDGAMYVSYAFSVAIVASIFIGFNVLIEKPTMTPMLISTFALTIGLSPLSFRLSRSIWIHIFYGFDKSKVNQYK